MKGNSKCTSSNSLSPEGAQNKDIGAALQTLLTEFKLRLRRRLDPVLQWRNLPSMNTKSKSASNKENKGFIWKHYRNTDLFSQRKGMWHLNLTFSNTLYSFRWTILLDYKYYIEYIICVFFLYNNSCNYDWSKLIAKNHLESLPDTSSQIFHWKPCQTLFLSLWPE